MWVWMIVCLYLLSCDKLGTCPVVAGIEFIPPHDPDMDKWKRVNGWINNSYKLPAESQICCMIKQFFSQTFVFLSCCLSKFELYDCKASSVLANYVFVLSLDKDRAAYSIAWEASPSLHLLSCELWQQQQEERCGGNSRWAISLSHIHPQWIQSCLCV